MRGNEWEKWYAAMKDEIKSLMKNNTWVLVDKPSSQRVVRCKWIFKKKVEVSDGNKVRYKARLVANGYSQ